MKMFQEQWYDEERRFIIGGGRKFAFLQEDRAMKGRFECEPLQNLVQRVSAFFVAFYRLTTDDKNDSSLPYRKMLDEPSEVVNMLSEALGEVGWQPADRVVTRFPWYGDDGYTCHPSQVAEDDLDSEDAEEGGYEAEGDGHGGASDSDKESEDSGPETTVRDDQEDKADPRRQSTYVKRAREPEEEDSGGVVKKSKGM